MPDLICPLCKKNPASEDKSAWPFCSKRCKDLDLGKWASGAYRVPVEHSEIAEDDDSVPTATTQNDED